MMELVLKLRHEIHNQHYQRHQEDFKNELQQEDANVYKLSMYHQYVKMTLESGNKEASTWLMKFRKTTLAFVCILSNFDTFTS